VTTQLGPPLFAVGGLENSAFHQTPVSKYKANMGKRPSVLVIEPQQSARTTLEMTLSHEGMRVFSAVSLDSALLQLRVLQPDLIIIGLDRQALEDSAATVQIRALSPAPLLVLGHEDGATPAAMPGIADSLPYPLNVEQLCAKVAKLLVGSRLPHSP
jgi:DNA-binding NtrC family response regulator